MAELVRWGFETDRELQDSASCVQRLAHVLCQAGAGALAIIAPKTELDKLWLETTDMGYMTNRLRGVPAHSDEFQHILFDFATHTENDCWPDDYYDEAAQGLPKDGALLFVPTGHALKSSVKILGLPLAPTQWAGHGTRHETAISVAAHLDQAVVLVRSSAGHMHWLFAHDNGHVALTLEIDNYSLVASISPLSVSTGEPASEPQISSLSPYSPAESLAKCGPSCTSSKIEEV